MDKDAALLLVSKDLFIEAWKHRLVTLPKDEGNFANAFADRFLALHEHIKSGINKK